MEINPFVYFFSLFAVFTASFIPFFVISFLIIIHELGHFLTAKLMGVEVDKIYLYPFGGISKFHMPLNISIFKEFLILMMGPIFQNIAALILCFLLPKDREIILIYHFGILIFNLLPIYPLDGGKLLNLIFSLHFSFQKSFYFVIMISYFVLFFLFLLYSSNLNFNFLFFFFFLLYKIIVENRKRKLLYEKFLLERYLFPKYYKKSELIQGKEDFYLGRRHLIKIQGKYYLEEEFLKKMFQKS